MTKELFSPNDLERSAERTTINLSLSRLTNNVLIISTIISSDLEQETHGKEYCGVTDCLVITMENERRNILCQIFHPLWRKLSLITVHFSALI